MKHFLVSTFYWFLIMIGFGMIGVLLVYLGFWQAAYLTSPIGFIIVGGFAGFLVNRINKHYSEEKKEENKGKVYSPPKSNNNDIK